LKDFKAVVENVMTTKPDIKAELKRKRENNIII